jgi:hypothetical protein
MLDGNCESRDMCMSDLSLLCVCVCARARVCVCDACACAQGVHIRWAAGQVCLIVRVQRSAFYAEPTRSDYSKYARAGLHTCARAHTHTHVRYNLYVFRL